LCEIRMRLDFRALNAPPVARSENVNRARWNSLPCKGMQAMLL
jgi:hypothetical protein